MEIALGNGYVLRDWGSAWEDGNRERFVSLADDYDVWRNLLDAFPHPYTLRDAEEWVTRHAGRQPITEFAICDAEGPIGALSVRVGTADYRHSAELGYWLGKPFWGQGITTAAVRAATTYAFGELGMLRVHAAPYVRNLGSTRVLEKAGFQREAHLRHACMKEGEALDYLIFGVLREEWHS